MYFTGRLASALESEEVADLDEGGLAECGEEAESLAAWARAAASLQPDGTRLPARRCLVCCSRCHLAWAVLMLGTQRTKFSACRHGDSLCCGAASCSSADSMITICFNDVHAFRDADPDCKSCRALCQWLLCCCAQAVQQQVGVLLGAAEQQGGLAPAPAAAASRISRLLAAKLEELRSMQPGGVAPTRRPSGGDSSGGFLYMDGESHSPAYCAP
jgi:hypothetical protein